jgi:hypothetical protein
MDQEMAKSLVNLIDETISEIEDLKKSRYSAAEAKIGDDDSGMAGKKKDGDIEKEEDAEKAEGKNSEADPGTRGVTESAMAADPGKSNLHAEAAKAEDKDDDDDEDDDEKKKKKDDMDKAEGKNSEADPGKHGDGKVKDAGNPGKSNLAAEAAKAEDAAKAEPAEGYDIKKSLSEQETLFKGYVDQKYDALEKKLSAILDVVKEMGDEPAARKGVPAGKFVPLEKSAGSGAETLSKGAALDKLFELKKSGTYVDTADIASVEMGGDFQAIVEKYSLN